MQPKIYMSIDDAAPALTADAGSLIALLDACLVDGYGEKAPAGWGKAFSGANLAAYRAPEGLRPYLRVDDTGGEATYAAQVARLEGYLDMSAITAGTGKFTSLTTGVYFGKSLGDDGNSPRQWLLAADDKRLILFSSRGNYINSRLFPITFGELVHHHPNDLNACYLTGADAAASAITVVTPSVTQGDLSPAVGGLSAVYMPGSLTGALAPARYNLDALGGGNGAPALLAPVLSDFIWCSRYVVFNSASTSSAAGAFATGSPRGYIAGLLFPNHLLSTETYPFWTDLGAGKRVIPRFGSVGANVLDTGDWEFI